VYQFTPARFDLARRPPIAARPESTKPEEPLSLEVAEQARAEREFGTGVFPGSVPQPRPAVSDDERFMALALDEARRAEALDEVPIGAVIVQAGEVVASAHNMTRLRQDPTAHAEMLAIRAAVRATGDLRLVGATVYTTVEPCFMCAGALSHARVERVVWGVRDAKFGGCASLGQVLCDPRLNHRATITEGVHAEEARALLQSFFRSKRTTPQTA